jgi:SAM-dependent methyltransferase
MDGLMREAQRHPFSGTCYTLGRQTMTLRPHEVRERFKSFDLTAHDLIDDSTIDATTTFVKRHNLATISDVAFFKALGFQSVKAIDISDFEGAEILFDLNADVPSELIGTCDLLVDGSTLDNLFDPIRALRNAVRLLKPNGRACFAIEANYVPDWSGVPYLVITPIWLYDFFVANRFAECSIYATIWTPAPSEEWRQTSYMLNHEHATRKWGGGIMKPIVTNFQLALAAFVRRNEESRADMTPQQHVYRNEADWQAYEKTVHGFMAAGGKPHIRSVTPMIQHRVPPGWNIVLPDGSLLNPESGAVLTHE